MSGACCSKVCVLAANVMSTGVEKDGCRTHRNDSGNDGGGIGRLSATVDNADSESAHGKGSGSTGCCFDSVHSPTATPVGSHCVEPNSGGTTWVAVAQLVGKKVISTAQVADCRMERVQTAHTASKGGAPIARAKLLGVAKTGC